MVNAKIAAFTIKSDVIEINQNIISAKIICMCANIDLGSVTNKIETKKNDRPIYDGVERSSMWPDSAGWLARNSIRMVGGYRSNTYLTIGDSSVRMAQCY